MLVDSHCHLDFPQLAEDRDGVLMRAEEAGVRVMQTITTKLSRFSEIVKIAEAHENIWCSVGVHPHSADQEGPESPGLPASACRSSEGHRWRGRSRLFSQQEYARRIRLQAFAPISKRHAKAGFRSLFTPVTPIKIR